MSALRLVNYDFIKSSSDDVVSNDATARIQMKQPKPLSPDCYVPEHNHSVSTTMGSFYDPTKVCSPDVYGATEVVAGNECEAPLNHGTRPPAGWDYVLVFHAPTSTSVSAITAKQRRIDSARISVLHDLQDASFHYSQLWIPSSGIILVRIGLPEEAMMEKAKLSGLKFRTRPEYSGGFIQFYPERFYIYENFNRRANGIPYFTPTERLMLTQLTLNSNEDWGVDIAISSLMRDGLLKEAYGLHSRRERNILIRACSVGWWRHPLKSLPLYALQEYLGTQVALYLAWILFFTRMHVGFSAFSLFIYLILTFGPEGDIRSWAYFIYGIALVFWGTYWTRNWQRRNAVINVQWGQSEGAEDRENMIIDSFVGKETEGFYSLGGFVHLKDLAETTELVTSSSLRAAAQEAHAEERLIDDTVEDENNEDNNGNTNYQPVPGHHDQRPQISAHTTLASLAGNSTRVLPPRVLTIGDGGYRGDQDFTLEAPIIGRTFSELPTAPYDNPSQQRIRIRVAGAVTMGFAGLVAYVSFALLYYRKEINVLSGMDPDSGVMTGILTACVIIVADGAWKSVSTDLTNWENHHTSKGYEDSIIIKRFAFQFVSNYLTLFYIAFVKPFLANDACMLNDSGVHDCMLELQTQLMSVVITKATVEQIIELLVPNLLSFLMQLVGRADQRKMRRSTNADEHNEEMTRLRACGAVVDPSVLNVGMRQMGRRYWNFSSDEACAEDEREENDARAAIEELRKVPYEGTVDDYAEIIIQYGFLVLFGLAFPLAAVINLVNNVVESRTDTFKILMMGRRPRVEIGTSIGRWMDIIKLISVLSVVTIVGMLTITTSRLTDIVDDVFPASITAKMIDSPLISFVVTEHLLFVIRWIVNSMVSDTPKSTHRLRARRSFLIAKCLDIGWKAYYGGRRARMRARRAWGRAEV